MKKRGIAYLYVLLIMIPVLMMIFALIDLTFASYKMGKNLIYKRQAEYNCETGLRDGMKRCSGLTYDKFRQATYYIDFNNTIRLITTEPDSKDFDKIIITYSSLNPNQKYTIDVIGNYMDACKEKTIIYNGG